MVTERFCKELRALDLLETMQATVTYPDGTTVSLDGFQAVSRARLAALPEATLGQLAKSGSLEFIYLHLLSLQNFEALKNRLLARTPPATSHGHA